MIIFIEKPQDALFRKASDSLIKKLSEQAKPNAIIQLDPEEMSLMASAQIVGLSDKSGPIELIEVKDGKNYIAVVDPHKTVIDDLIKMIPRIQDASNIQIGIVRTRL